MNIAQGKLNFRFRMKGDQEWSSISIHLDHLRKKDLTDTETLSEDIHEYLYAEDDRTYRDPDAVEYDVISYWNDIVERCHEHLYGEKDSDEWFDEEH